VTNTERGSCPRDRLSFDEYLARRVNKQIKYYRSKANDYAPVAARLRTAEWVIALFGALVSAIAGITKIPGFDIAALTALLTTLGGIVVTHRQASHYEEIISTYRATANRLEYATQTKDPQISLGDFAQKVETIIEGETKSWAAGWSKT
jgi:SMODS and SLOG-associating 2TM effector domain 1